MGWGWVGGRVKVGLWEEVWRGWGRVGWRGRRWGGVGLEEG